MFVNIYYAAEIGLEKYCVISYKVIPREFWPVVFNFRTNTHLLWIYTSDLLLKKKSKKWFRVWTWITGSSNWTSKKSTKWESYFPWEMFQLPSSTTSSIRCWMTKAVQTHITNTLFQFQNLLKCHLPSPK